ncbi:MAG: dihydroorotate dehydrogenase catalytic subunit [Thermomicrobiales bacterium]|nr:dihydroorotate dehydrogenase catalytic subunit [Thermomicrobiales bacterium]
MVSLAVDLAPRNPRELRLTNPVIAASGCFGYGQEYAGIVDVQRLGAFVSTSITLRPRHGNPMPRLTETPAGLLSAVGLQNPGVRVFARKYPPIWSTWSVPAIVSVAGESVDEYAAVAEALDEVPGVAAIELNLGSADRNQPHVCFGWDPDQTALVTEAVRASTSLPIIAKLSPTPVGIVDVALAAEEAGADAVSLINSFPGMVIDTKRRRPTLAAGAGGLSGPAIKPIAVQMVHDVAAAVSVPVIGIGGIASLADVLEFLMAGASAIQIGTAIFAQPTLLTRLIGELEEWMTTHGIDDLGEIVGAAVTPDLSGDSAATTQAVVAG